MRALCPEMSEGQASERMAFCMRVLHSKADTNSIIFMILHMAIRRLRKKRNVFNCVTGRLLGSSLELQVCVTKRASQLQSGGAAKYALL